MYTEDFEIEDIKIGTKIGFTRPQYESAMGGGGLFGEYGWGIVVGTSPDNEFRTHTGETVDPDEVGAIDNSRNWDDGIEKADDWVISLIDAEETHQTEDNIKEKEMYIKFSDGTVAPISLCEHAVGIEHKFPSPDCGDIEIGLGQVSPVEVEKGEKYLEWLNEDKRYLEGEDKIRWDEMDVLIDWINEAALARKHNGEVPPPPDGMKKYLSDSA